MSDGILYYPIRHYNTPQRHNRNRRPAVARRSHDISLSRQRVRPFERSGAPLAFYDAPDANDSAVKVLGDAALQAIARELVETVRRNASIDWTIRENVRAQMRVLVRRILREHGYPPDKQERATRRVIEQAATLSRVWAA